MRDSSSVKDGLCIAAIIVMSVIFCHRLAFSPPDRILAGFDMGHMQYFWAHFKCNAYLNGVLPLWCPFIFGGQPHAALPVTAVFYPPDILYFILPLARAMNWSLVIHQFVAGIFTYFFCREIKLKSIPALIGAVAFMLNGYFINHLSLGHVGIVRTSFYLPIVFYFVERGLTRKDFRSFLLAGLVLALQILCGHTQFYFYTILFLCFYAGLRTILFRDKNAGVHAFLSPILMTLFAVGLAVTLTLFQFLLGVEFTQLSDRAARSIDFAAFGSIHPAFLLQLFYPNLTIGQYSPLPENSAYAGIIPIGMAVFALLGCWRNKGYALLISLIGLLSLLLMLGDKTPFFYLFYYVVPGLKLFRVHSRSILVFAFCLSVLAAIGTQELFSGESRQEGRGTWGMTIGVLVAGFLFLAIMAIFFRDHLSRDIFTAWFSVETVKKAVQWKNTPVLLPLVWLGLAIMGLFFLRKVKAPTIIQLLIVGLIWLDLFTGLAGKLKTFHVGELTLKKEFMRKVDDTEGLFRVWFPAGLYASNRAMVDEIENMNGYTPLFLERYDNYLSTVTGMRLVRTIFNHLKPELFGNLPVNIARLFNVRFAIIFDESTGRYSLIESPEYGPRAYMVNSFQLAETEAESLDLVTTESFNPLERVILEERPATRLGPPGSNSQIHDIRAGLNHMEVDYDSSVQSMLVVSEQYYPGWKASLDGEPVKMFRANYLLRAVEAPPGKHTVRFYYRPIAMTLGLPISLLALVGTIAAYVWLGRRKVGSET